METIIQGTDVKVDVGSYVELDSGHGAHRGNRLLPCTEEPCAGWPGASFRWPNPIRGWEETHAIACNVTVTGRTIQYRYGSRWVRIRVEWVGDCEPSTYTPGWLMVE